MSEKHDSSGAGRRVAVVGGGLAGMAAAVILAEAGCQVDLFEQKHRIGGRVGSFCDPVTGELVDYCMHVSMGCCTNFLDFIRRTGIDDCFQRHHRLTFIGPEGETCRFDSWRWLPAPLHLLPGFARLKYLTLGERLSIGRCLFRLGRLRPDACQCKTAGQWLREQGQTQRCIQRFWAVVLVSALGDTVDRVALSMARKVFLDGFMRTADGYEVLLPKMSLGEIFNQCVGRKLRQLGVTLHLGSRVQAFEMAAERAEALLTAQGEPHRFDALIVALPWTAIGRVTSPPQRRLLCADWKVDQVGSSAITAVHLWFDREITQLPHAALVGRTSDWVFRHEALYTSTSRHHYQVLISASDQRGNLSRAELLEEVLRDLRAVWPNARTAQVVHHRIVTERHAVFSVTPDGLRCRPGCGTRISNCFLAGDWTDTPWPATMEGAIFSGYAAASQVLRTSEAALMLPLDTLRPSWLARVFLPLP